MGRHTVLARTVTSAVEAGARNSARVDPDRGRGRRRAVQEESAVKLQSLVAVVCALALALAPPLPAAEPIRLASLEWEPYVGPNLPDQGYASALVRAAFAEEGIAVEIEFFPWARALHLARTGEVDGLMPEYYDASRETDFVFSDRFPGGPLVLYKRKADAIAFVADPQRDPEQALQGLKAQRFGVVRGYLNTPSFDAASYLSKEEASDDATNLRKLVFARIDLAVIDGPVAAHLIRTRYPDYADKLEPMSPPLAEMPLYIAFSRKSARMEAARAAFNRGLAALAADGRLERLRQQHLLSAAGGR
jgi:ABC-type amino acid transport substrate-binding protein